MEIQRIYRFMDKKDFDIENFIEPPTHPVPQVLPQKLARVLRATGGFQCGMCGSFFAHLNDAWKCLEKNLSSIAHFPTFISSNNGYHCLTCSKIYMNLSDAVICVTGDIELSPLPPPVEKKIQELVFQVLENHSIRKRAQLFSRSQYFGINFDNVTLNKTQKTQNSNHNVMKKILSDQAELEEEEKPKTTTKKVTQKNEVKKENIKAETKTDDITPTAEETMDPEEFVIGAFQKGGDTSPSENSEKAVPPKPILYRKADQKPFIRNGSQYECSVCQETFFTKAEADTHFLEHPLK